MRIKTAARGLTLFVGLTVALTVMAVPASAAEPNAVASIANRTFLAGTPEALVQINVTNLPDPTFGPTSVAPSINFIAVAPPLGFYTPIPVFQVPIGWGARIAPNGMVVFFTETDPIPPGASNAFTLTSAIGRPTVDINRKWRVQVSGDQGDSLKDATADPAASPTDPTNSPALTTTIRVLQVLNTRLTAPPGVTDNSVSSGQTVDAQLDVTNAGSGTLSVTPNLTFSGASGSTATATVTCPKPGEPAFPVDMGPGTTRTFLCSVRFNRTTSGNGNGTLTGRATGTHADGNATALTSSTAITVMTAAVFNYVSQSLQPTDVSPGRDFIFRLSVSKSGEVAVNLNKANTTLSFGPPAGEVCDPSPCPTFTATLKEPAVVPAGGTATTPLNVLLEFNSATIPPNMPANDGTGKREYTPTLNISGTDQNDFGVSTQPAVTDKILVDALGPILNLATTPPPSRVMGEKAAASNGLTIAFSGDIRDRGALCGACPIVTAVVRQFDAAQVPIAGADIPVTIRNDQGNLSGSFNGNYSPQAFFMALVVVGADPGGNTTEAQSQPPVDVDNILPSVTTARTGTITVEQDGEQVRANRGIDVNVSEPLAAAGMSPSDWVVTGHRVVAADPQRDGQSSRGNFTSVRLTVDPELGRNEETNVTYAPAAASRANDRVGLLLPNATVLALDGIVPRLPDVLTISGLEEQDDDDGNPRFWSNDPSPDIGVEIDPGDTVTFYEDLNGNGQIDPGTDAQLCSVKADPGEEVVTCTPAGLGSTDRTLRLLGRSIDGRGNLGPTSNDLLTLDFIRPTIGTIQLLGPDLQVVFSESLTLLRDGDSAFDWTVFVRDAGVEAMDSPDNVDPVEDEEDERILRGDGYWITPGVRVLRVRYLFDAVNNVHDRYADRAGNELLDQTFLLPA